jgi:hypothetical protein
MFIVNDLLANIDRCAIEIEGFFDGDNCTVYAGAISTRCG